MQLETEIRQDPVRRADVFVQRRQALDRQHRMLLRDREDTRANTIGDRMSGMAKSLERDPQVESILRNRRVQLGLNSAGCAGCAGCAGVGRELADMIGRRRGRGLNIGM